MKIKAWENKVGQLFLSRNLHPDVRGNEYDILEEFPLHGIYASISFPIQDNHI